MPNKQLLNLMFQIVLFIVFAFAVYAAQDWPTETRYFPNALGILMMGLTAVTFIQDLRRYRGTADSRAAEHDGDDGAVVMMKAMREFGWLGGAAFGIWLIGFYPAIFLLLLGFFYFRAEVGIVRSLLGAVAATAIMFAVFYYVLEVPAYTGVFGGLVR